MLEKKLLAEREFVTLDAKANAGFKKAYEEEVAKILDKYPEFIVEYTHKGNPKPKYFDIADAIVIANAGMK